MSRIRIRRTFFTPLVCGKVMVLLGSPIVPRVYRVRGDYRKRGPVTPVFKIQERKSRNKAYFGLGVPNVVNQHGRWA
jgi:hypothetical protein